MLMHLVWMKSQSPDGSKHRSGSKCKAQGWSGQMRVWIDHIQQWNQPEPVRKDRIQGISYLWIMRALEGSMIGQ